MVERHIEFIDEHDRSVHLPSQFVRHFMRREDALPFMVAINQLPIVLADGTLLAGNGLDRARGIFFTIPKELSRVLPASKDCAQLEVETAMKFLCDEWLADVATNYTGKCIIIAAALTVIQRSLLPDRPAFLVTAGRRGTGKTTTITMLLTPLTGSRPAAATWSNHEEERRKALLSYFMRGESYILWDNIPRGSQISCPHIERSCTSAYYADRRLGVSEMVTTAASSVHFFTGNNINVSGDLVSRCLHIRLDADRPDPENREFTHPDPIAWTEQQRAKSWARSTHSCSATRNSICRPTPRARPASSSGGGSSVQQSRTRPHLPERSWTSGTCSCCRKTRTRTQHRSPMCWKRCSNFGQRSRSASQRRSQPSRSHSSTMSMTIARKRVYCATGCAPMRRPTSKSRPRRLGGS